MREAIELVTALTFDTNADLPLEAQVEDCLEEIWRCDPDSTTDVSLAHIEILDHRSEHDVMDQSAQTIVLHAPSPYPGSAYADDVRDSAGDLCPFLNQYSCDCGKEWFSQWSSTCNDRCPDCNKSTAAWDSIKLITRDQITPQAFDVRMTGAVIAALEMLASKMAGSHFKPCDVMTAQYTVAPVARRDVERLIETLKAQFALKRSKLALGQGVQTEEVIGAQMHTVTDDL